MGIVLFALFAVIEITLTVLTCTRYREKQSWRKNRAAFTAAELLLIILMLIFPVGNKWRFFGCLAVTALRFAVSGIIYLVRKNKASGSKSKVGTVIGALFSMLITILSLVPSFLFTGYDGLKLTGEYGVKTTEAILIDKSRLEKNENDGSNREVPIHFYYPDGDAENCPFVLFDHGSFGYYQSNSSLYTELASNGFVVASIDHPYYAFFTTDTSGQTIIADMDFIQTAVNMENNAISDEESFGIAREWLETRSADENFVLDSIKSAKKENSLDDSWHTENKDEILSMLNITDMEKIGLTGHSIGGAMAVKLGRERDDITAVIDIDGTMSSERTDFADGKYVYNDEPYPIPVLALDNEVHGGYYRESPLEGMDYINKHVLDNAADGREMSFAGTKHLDFTDLPLLAPGIVKMTGMGSADAEKFIPELNSIVLNYFTYYLKGEGELIPEQWNSQS